MGAVYIDGQWHSKENAVVSVYDHGLLYGDGVFEGLRFYNRKIFKLKAHLDRLFDSAAALCLKIPPSLEELTALTEEAVRRQGAENGYIRIVVTRGKGDLGISPWNCETATVIIIADKITMYPEEMYREGIKIITAATRRLPQDIYDPRIKSLNYLSNIMAKIEARNAGCLEAVMLNREGYVTECTGDNLFIVKQGSVMTPPEHAGLLAGITRKTILEIAGKADVPVKEKMLTRYDLYTADECFLTGSGAEIIPVVNVDGRIVGSGVPGEVTGQIRGLFGKQVQSVSE